MEKEGRVHRGAGRRWLALLLTTTLIAGCGSATLPPSASARPSESTAPATPAPSSSSSPSSAVASMPAPTATATPTLPVADLAISMVARAPADPAAATTAATAIDGFGLDLYRRLLADPDLGLAGQNEVISPASIALALGMALAGARGTTATQMDQVLHTSGWPAFGEGLNSLEQALVARDASWTDYSGDHALSLRIANAAYGQAGWTIEQAYLDAIKSAFGAGLRLADFAADPAAAREAINAWVKEQTAGRIPELLQPPDVTALTRLVLVNAMYLRAGWEAPFEAQLTTPAAFTRFDGSQVAVPTMEHPLWAGGLVPYASGTGWRATELRYAGGPQYGNAPLAMTLVLPDDLPSFEASLTAAQLARITAALAGQRTALTRSAPCPGENPLGCECSPYGVDLFLPRFSIDTRAGLNNALAALGMPRAFDPDAADFTGIHTPASPQEQLYISTVIHQANIDVDEKGTEAAAATAVGMATGGGCGGPNVAKTIALRLDHPFLFFVRDLATGAVLFMGQVTDPSA